MAAQNMPALTFRLSPSVNFSPSHQKELESTRNPGKSVDDSHPYIVQAMLHRYQHGGDELLSWECGSCHENHYHTSARPIDCAENDRDETLQLSRRQDRQRMEADQLYDAVGEELTINEDNSWSGDDEADEHVEFRSLRQDISEDYMLSSSCLDFALDNGSKRQSSGDNPGRRFRKSSSDSFLHLLPLQATTHDFEYKGISSNPPEITKRGIARGNAAQIHRKAWLEVCDPKHRYGKNLRLYYRHWEFIGCPTNNFFDWLDSKGEAAGEPLPSIDECPRSKLDSDIVLYISDNEQTSRYAMQLVADELGRCHVLDIHNKPVVTGHDGWIFVLRDDVFYGAEKLTSISDGCKQRFHHSSFFGGKAVAAAGVFITNDEGVLSLLYPHSGHYRPGEADMQRILFFLHERGADLNTFQVDMQQLIRVNRHDSNNTNKPSVASDQKKRKIDSLHLKPAMDVAYYLSHKARFISEGILPQIHNLRRSESHGSLP